MKRRFIDAVLVAVGFILSPLTWWNDMIVNVPLAYVFSFPFSLIDQQLFSPSLIFGYWLNSLIFEMSTCRMLFSQFKVLIDNGQLKASAWGEPINVKQQ